MGLKHDPSGLGQSGGPQIRYQFASKEKTKVNEHHIGKLIMSNVLDVVIQMYLVLACKKI